MIAKLKYEYWSLFLWILSLIGIGGLIGATTKPELHSWYHQLLRSPLTPPNYVFPLVWTILYGMLGGCGWLLWRQAAQPSTIRRLYLLQLVLNWAWTPVFFGCHLIGSALVILLLMDVLVSLMLYYAYPYQRYIMILLIPYLWWLLFASYLNGYIWYYN